MDLSTYERLIKSESAARKYLLGFCWKNQQRFCPRCRSRKFYRLKDGRRRCARCRYPFHDFTGRWINRGALRPDQWLRLIKLFELELSARKMAAQLQLSYATVYKALTTIRQSIWVHTQQEAGRQLGGEVELDESYFGGRRKGKRGRGAAGKVPVFGTDRYRIYDALMFCGYRHLKVDHGKQFSRGRVYINGLEGFWSWAKERVIKHHGISARRFPLYLKELEFRYNHRDQDIFTIITQYLCDFVPNRD